MELSAPFHKRRSVPLLFALIIFLVCTVYLAYNTSVPTRVRIPDQHHMIGPNTENPATATAMIIQRERIKNVNALRHDDKHIWDLNTLGIGNPKMVNMELFGIDHLEKRKENEVNENPIETEERKKCYRYAEDDKSNAAIKLFDDVLLSNRHPRIDKTMFFIVTTCFADQLAQLNPRQACAIESAATRNPSLDIFVLFASPAGFAENSTLHTPVVNALKSHPNLYFRNINLWSIAADTPLEDWIQQGVLFHSKHFLAHTSDYLRLITLYRFGGIYMDLVFVVQKSFENVELNFFGCERNDMVGSAVLSFTQSGIGHEIASQCVNDFVTKFDGTIWDFNGPLVFTRVLRKICKTDNALEMTRERCSGAHVFLPNEFYAVPWMMWRLFIDPIFADDVLARTEDSLAVHFWNKETRNEKVSKDAAYGRLAQKNCPNIYVLSEHNF